MKNISAQEKCFQCPSKNLTVEGVIDGVTVMVCEAGHRTGRATPAILARVADVVERPAKKKGKRPAPVEHDGVIELRRLSAVA
jgi:hypothetical protein